MKRNDFRKFIKFLFITSNHIRSENVKGKYLFRPR